jgi:hypothetical protein
MGWGGDLKSLKQNHQADEYDHQKREGKGGFEIIM